MNVKRNGVGLLAALLGGLALGACGGQEAPPRLETTIDTVAGVVHVRHEGSAPEWTLEPVLEIGEAGGLSDAPSPEEFGRVARVVADGAGRVYVADQMLPAIRVFGPAGRYLRTIGRGGAGPGELGGLYGMEWLAPDTFLVVDPGNARLTALTVAGEQVEQWRWARLSGPAKLYLFNGGRGEAYAIVLAPERVDGRLLARWGRFTLAHAPEVFELPTPETLVLQLPENEEICETEQSIGFQSNPYAPMLVRAPAPGRERAVGVSDAYRIAFIDPEGDTTRVLERSVATTPIPDSARTRLAAEIDTFHTRYHGADCHGEIAEAATLPILRDLFFDYDGRLLVEYNRPDGPAFDLLDGEGHWIATFPALDRDRSVPPYLRGDRLYTVTRDSLGVQRVQVNRLVAPEG